uniref:BTB domain-containing protein n=1 Tax=Panagrellus redivivus TaxID=6233 RepID=A0A7E4W4L6_PANRE
MSVPIKITRSIEDACSIKLTKAKLRWDVGRQSFSQKREIPYTNGTKWWLSMYPGGESDEFEDYISVRFNVTAPVNVHVTFAIEDTEIKKVICHPYIQSWICLPRFASHDDVWPELCGTSLELSCTVKFDFDLRPKCLKSSLFHSCDHIPMDFEFVVGDSNVKAHRQFLALISPVFHAVFSHDTIEARTGQLVVKDFEFNVVKAAIDFCYGRELNDNSIETIVGVLRFGDKYDIKSFSAELEKVLLFNLNSQSFCVIAHYAFDCSKADIMEECAKFFKENINKLKESVNFQNLPSKVVYELLKHAFSSTTIDEVLSSAHKYRIKSVIEMCMQPLFNSMSPENFVTNTKYAWSFSCENLQRKCAEYFNDHRLETATMDLLLSLEPETAFDLMKMAAEIRTSNA